MITKIIDDLGLDMYDRPETTAMNLHLIDELLEYMLGDKILSFDKLEFVFNDEYDRFYSDDDEPHTIVDDFTVTDINGYNLDVLIIRKENE